MSSQCFRREKKKRFYTHTHTRCNKEFIKFPHQISLTQGYFIWLGRSTYNSKLMHDCYKKNVWSSQYSPSVKLVLLEKGEGLFVIM